MNRLAGPVAQLIHQRRRFDANIQLTQGDTCQSNHRQTESVSVAFATGLQIAPSDEVGHESVGSAGCQPGSFTDLHQSQVGTGLGERIENGKNSFHGPSAIGVRFHLMKITITT